MYAVLALLAWFAATAEYRDVRCPYLPGKTPEMCALGADISYQGSLPRPGDAPEVLLGKIVNASHGVQREIVWRKAFLSSLVASVLIYGIVFRKLPAWHEFYVAVLIGYVVNAQLANYYKHHVYRAGVHNTEQAVKQLSITQQGTKFSVLRSAPSNRLH